MNITEYISSGILESYVMGDLTEREIAEVERNLSQYSELKAEVEKIEEAQEKILMATAVKPPASVRSLLFEKVESPEVVELRGDQGKVWKYAAAASIVVALITSYLAYNFHNKWKAASADLTALITQNQRIAEDYNNVNQKLDRITDEVRIMNNPEFKRVVMKGTPNAPEALATVYWNESSREVYLGIHNLKELVEEQQYQLWAIIDGKPVDAGVFDPDNTALLKMKEIPGGAVTFAVTVEPRGGRPSPSLEAMQMAGNVQKG